MTEPIDCGGLFGCDVANKMATIKQIGGNIALQCTEQCAIRIEKRKSSRVCCFFCPDPCETRIGIYDLDITRLKIISFLAKCKKNGNRV